MQGLGFLLGELEHELFGESVGIAFDLFVEALGRNAVELGQIGIKNDFVATDAENERSDFLGDFEGFWHD